MRFKYIQQVIEFQSEESLSVELNQRGMFNIQTDLVTVTREELRALGEHLIRLSEVGPLDDAGAIVRPMSVSEDIA